MCDVKVGQLRMEKNSRVTSPRSLYSFIDNGDSGDILMDLFDIMEMLFMNIYSNFE